MRTKGRKRRKRRGCYVAEGPASTRGLRAFFRRLRPTIAARADRGRDSRRSSYPTATPADNRQRPSGGGRARVVQIAAPRLAETAAMALAQGGAMRVRVRCLCIACQPLEGSIRRVGGAAARLAPSLSPLSLRRAAAAADAPASAWRRRSTSPCGHTRSARATRCRASPRSAVSGGGGGREC